ncbi:hypothetical protein EDB19DRAFT_1907976 [Suillus lakei]|nr:hypothetical protein EDB19DRAFT_1907976 [Suillus lakei]
MKRWQFVQRGYNAIFEPVLGFSGEVCIMDQQNELIDLRFDLKSHKCTTHFGLYGHIITVFSVENKKLSARVSEFPHHPHTGTDELVAKLYQPGGSCESNSEKGHVLEMAWFHKFEGTSPAKIRMALGMDAERGGRVSYIIVSRKFCPITNLSGKELLSACPSGNERTGTVPFMALNSLTKEAIQGEMEHVYQHDAESFIWVLTWACLHYEDGVLTNRVTELTKCLGVDARECFKEKSSFLNWSRHTIKPLSSHESNWKTALLCLGPVALFYAVDPTRTVDDEIVFRTWLEEHVKAKLPLSLLDVRLEKK